MTTRNLVVCCDGTGNEIGTNLSNVLKLYRVLDKDEGQRVYYNPGVGTIGLQNPWQRFKQKTRGVLGLATGYGLDYDVLHAYRFLCELYQSGDEIWLFGFSRGAYTVRVLAAFIHVMGMLPPDQLNLADYAFEAYKAASAANWRERKSATSAASPQDNFSPALHAAWDFSRVARARTVTIKFVGVWDTVASVIVPRRDILLPDIQTLRFTRRNPSVRFFRQAMAIDERRRMFRLNAWLQPQDYRPNPFKPADTVAQDIRQVWFAGVHADVGGGYPEPASGLSKYPLAWLIEQAAAQGLRINRAMVNQLVLGRPRPGSKRSYVAPDCAAQLHNSMNWAWAVLEWLPKAAKWKEWPARSVIFGCYLPRAEPRVIAAGALIHRSVVDRMAAVAAYRPVNLPPNYVVEDVPNNSAAAKDA